MKVFLSLVCALLLAATATAGDIVNSVVPESQNAWAYDYMRTYEIVQADVSVATATLVSVNLAAEDRTYTSQGFTIYNMDADYIEWALGGASLTTCSGDDPVTELSASVSYSVVVADAATVRVGQIIEIYDASSSNAVLLKGRVTSINYTSNLLYVSYISGTTPTDAAADDVVGGPNRYTFAHGEGHVVFGTSASVPVRPLPGYSILHLYGSTAEAQLVRVVQSH